MKKIVAPMLAGLLVFSVGCKDKGTAAPAEGKKVYEVPKDTLPVPERVTDPKNLPVPVLVSDPQSFMKRPPVKEGVVTVEYIVEPDGRVNAARIAKSDLGKEVDAAVLESVQKSIYEKSGKRVLLTREIMISPPAGKKKASEVK